MPSILFHELVGYKIAKKYKKYDNPDFYLGIIVPDAINAYGFASKEKRWATHFRHENLKKWQENIINFYKQNTKKYQESYLFGYLVHVLTDILCDKIYQEDLYPQLINQGYDYNSAYSYYTNQIQEFEHSKLNESWWEYVKLNLEKAKKMPINNIDEEMINDWIIYILNKYNNKNYEKTGDMIENFLQKVIDELDKILNNEQITTN